MKTRNLRFNTNLFKISKYFKFRGNKISASKKIYTYSYNKYTLWVRNSERIDTKLWVGNFLYGYWKKIIMFNETHDIYTLTEKLNLFFIKFIEN